MVVVHCIATCGVGPVLALALFKKPLTCDEIVVVLTFPDCMYLA
jgi:hypothetical protein